MLYINYVEDISENEYVKFSCKNKGKCCNINHMKKYSYNKTTNNQDNAENDKDSMHSSISNEPIHINLDKNKLIVEL